MNDTINHPPHYGGENNVYETIKVIEAWGLNASFCLGNAVKYISRAGKKLSFAHPIASDKARLEDLKKARWYLDREIANMEKSA